jgi:ATP phosphoribosyltransferase
MAANLSIAVPSKGRLKDQASELFERAGIGLRKSGHERGYRGALAGLDGVEVVYLSAAEIVHQLKAGGVHLGVTGEDLIRETLGDVDGSVEFLRPLGFGRADVVVAVPDCWIDVGGMADLEDVAASFRARRGERMRVATKYINLTRRFFAKMHVSDYRIVESSGATEGAPAAGSADLIVDITTTGATLVANALKVLDDGVILRSQANLVASLTAPWSETAREAARVILSRIAAEEAARTTREVRAALPLDEPLVREAESQFGAKLRERHGETITFACPTKQVASLADWAIGKGAKSVTSARLDYVFNASNDLWSRLAARIG